MIIYTCGSRIDYQRRRDLIPAETITTGQWRDLALRRRGAPRRSTPDRDAQRYLFQLLTGADLHDPRHALTFTGNYDYSRYHAFAYALPTGLRDALHHHAAALLHDLDSGEPLTWAPPPGCCGLDLPGPTRTYIDPDAVAASSSPRSFPSLRPPAAGTTGGHLRLALDRGMSPAGTAAGRLPRPRSGASMPCLRNDPRVLRPRVHRRGQEPAAAGSRHRHSCRFLTQVAREHEHHHDRPVLARASCPNRTSPAPAIPPDPATRFPATSAARPKTARQAGALGLRRFQTAMASPTIAAAAARLRISPSALSHQFRRLERDIGAKLYQPATSRRPWRPTHRGAALLTALAQPGTQALAAAHAAQISSRAGSRYRDRMPISLGPDATAARQAASLFRILANPTRLAILLTLQTGEQRITDLTALLGGSQANISAHLMGPGSSNPA